MNKLVRNDVSLLLPDQELLAQLTPFGSPSGEGNGDEHLVQFYEDDSSLIKSVSQYIFEGLKQGEVCVSIATRAHREAFVQALSVLGLDVVNNGYGHQYYQLDASETLALLMDGETVDESRFNEIVVGLITRASSNGRRVRAFGEMVSLLSASGNFAGAVHLEELWNELRARQSFALFCAYSLDLFNKQPGSSALLDVCGQHSHVIPAESYNA